MKTGKVAGVGLAVAALTVLTSCGSSESDDTGSEGKSATVGIVTIAPIEAMELVEEGFKEGMADCDVEIEYESRNAEGDVAALGPIVTGFLDNSVDLILATSTPAAQAAVTANESDGRETPVLFGAVTDPYAAGIAQSPDEKFEWLTGWQADAPVTGMFDIAEEIVPDIESVGVAYDPSQVNSETAVARMKEEAEARGMTIETATISDSSEVGTASQALAGRDVDVFFAPTDSILVNGLSGMLSVADEHDIPVIAQDSNITKAGAAIGTGLDYRGDGGRLAEQACQILAGDATPADFPIDQFEESIVAYNSTSAEAQEITVPEWILEDGVDNSN